MYFCFILLLIFLFIVYDFSFVFCLYLGIHSFSLNSTSWIAEALLSHHQTYTSFLSSDSRFFLVSVDGADDVIGWLRFGRLGESVFELKDNCRANRDIRFVIELLRVNFVRVSTPFCVKSSSATLSLSSISVIGWPVELNGCVFRLGIGGVEGSCDAVDRTRTTEKFVAVASAGSIRASDGLFFRAAKEKSQTIWEWQPNKVEL